VEYASTLLRRLANDIRESFLHDLRITTGQKVGQNHRFENEPRRHVGALVPWCRWKNDKKWRLGTMLSMD